MTLEEATAFKNLHDISEELSASLEEAYNDKCSRCSEINKDCKNCICRKWFQTMKKFESL